MHLTTEFRNIGLENFYAAIGSELGRRDLLRKINAEELRSGHGLGNLVFGYGTVEKPVRVAILGSGDQSGILIGAMNPKYVQVVAFADIRPFNHHRTFHGDAANAGTLELRPGLISVFGWRDEAEAREHVKAFGRYEELLDYYKDKEGDEGIEAVVIGLPLHLHASAAIAAMKQGYHVLTEKLMAHTVAECKEMARAAEIYKKHCATGHQRHYNVLYDHVVKMIQDNLIGDIHYIRAQWHRGNRPGADSWRPPVPREISPDPNNVRDSFTRAVPGEPERQGFLGWQLTDREVRLERMAADHPDRPLLAKQVAQLRAQVADRVLVDGGEFNGFTFQSAEDCGYVSEEAMSIDGALPFRRPAGEELIRWRLFNRTSAGLMAELGSHQLDAASIFLSAMLGGKQYPLSVSATETRTVFPEDLEVDPVDRDVESHIHCVYDYPARGYDANCPLGRLRTITLAYSSINGSGFGGYGETVFGTVGTLQIDTELEAMLYQRAAVDQKTRLTAGPQGAPHLTLNDEGDQVSAAIGLQSVLSNALGRGYTEQIEHWAYCIRENPEADHSKEMPRCYPEVALADAVVTLATNIAAQLQEPVEFDMDWFRIESDATPEAKFAARTGDTRNNLVPNLARFG